MGSNRKRPFGYKMEFGEIVLHPAEAETVRWIYDSYLAGASYNALVDKLRERGKLPRLVGRRGHTSICQQLVRGIKAGKIAYFGKNHSTHPSADARDGGMIPGK